MACYVCRRDSRLSSDYGDDKWKDDSVLQFQSNGEFVSTILLCNHFQLSGLPSITTHTRTIYQTKYLLVVNSLLCEYHRWNNINIECTDDGRESISER